MVATAHAVGQLLYAGLADRAELLFSRIGAFEADAAGPSESDPAVWAWVHSARATQALFVGDPAAYLKRRQAAAQCFEQAGDLRNACVQRVSVGYAYMELGASREAEEALRDALAAAERMGLSNVAALAKHNLGFALALAAGNWSTSWAAHVADVSLEEARALEADAVSAFVAQGNRRLEGGARIYLALILARSGDLGTADAEARRAVEVTTPTPPARAHALATLARVALARDAVREAVDAATEAMVLLDTLGGIDEGESFVRLVHAEALSASGDHDRARRSLSVARARLLDRAAKIKDPEWRTSFLERVPWNARTMELASEA
jgi:tetratricopeptide (TPR) repeat protein